MPQINPVWKEKFFIGTAKTGDTWTYSPLCAGIQGLAPSVNENTQTYYFLCGNGGADNVVTTIAPQYAVTGRRVIGDDAQDYIASLRYALGDDRKSSMKVEIYDAAGTKVETIIADVTITDIVDFGGQAEESEPFSCTLRVNGLPEVTTP
jgi:hypothetical protein